MMEIMSLNNLQTLLSTDRTGLTSTTMKKWPTSTKTNQKRKLSITLPQTQKIRCISVMNVEKKLDTVHRTWIT